MGVEHVTYDAAYFQGQSAPLAYGGYTDIAGPLTLEQAQGVGVTTAQKFLDKGFSLVGRDVLVLGCGVGSTVEHYRTNEGVNAWGLDVSAWAVANTLAPGFVLEGDARTEANLDAVEAAAGVNRWDAIITEQLIPGLSDADLATALPMWRDHATPRAPLDWSGMIHYVHTHQILDYAPHLGATWDPQSGWSGPRDAPYTNRTLAEWRTFLDSTLVGNDRPDWVWTWVTGDEG